MEGSIIDVLVNTCVYGGLYNRCVGQHMCLWRAV